ncbi:hypothetical protein ACQP00_16340 [Dactylosporangium sp. CS-047395]|uniref:hypothetical protein n=1 Tax=Dactylosporangium sp. CS-047395 TaxID=3239936 RepID=UPI003D8BC43D
MFIEVPFAGAGSGRAELTWGQRAMVQAMAREDSWLPMGGCRPLAPGTTLADVAAQVRYTIERWQSFRTLFRDGMQEVVASGVARFEVLDGVSAAAVEARYRAAAPDLAADWPMRMAVVRRDGVPAEMVAVMPHLVTDGLGAAIMVDESTRRVATPPAGLQPLDIAAWQQGPQGARQHAGARRHFSRHADGLEEFASVVASPRYRKCLLESPLLATRLPMAAARFGTDESTVLLAAYFVALSRISGRSVLGVRQVVSNRFRTGLSDVVSPLTQLGLCVVDVPPTFPEAVAAVARAALPARKYAYYDPLDIPSLATPCFNDRRAVSTTSFGAERSPSPGVLTFSAQAGPTEPLFLHVDAVQDGMRLIFDFDSGCFSESSVGALARCLEGVV